MTTTITVEGMSCENCEWAVEQALRDVIDVSNARADHGLGARHHGWRPDSDALVRAVEDPGYDPRCNRLHADEPSERTI